MLDEFDDILDIRDKSRYVGKKGKKVNSSDLVKNYLAEISRYPLLSAEDEEKYGKIIKENPEIINSLKENIEFSDDKDKVLELIQKKEDEIKIAKQIMINSNLRLVVSIAKHYVGKGLTLLDLIQEGNLGLIRAVERFDYTYGTKFSTYATWWIKQCVTRGIADHGRTVRIPVHTVEKLNKLKSIEADFIKKYNRVPSEEELALEMDVPVDTVRDLIKYNEEPVSLNSFIQDEDNTELIEFIQDENVDVENETIDHINHQYTIDMLNKINLSDREKFIILYRNGYSREDIVSAIGEDAVKYIEFSSGKRNIDLNWGVENTFEETAEIYGVSRERIRQIVEKAKLKIKRYLLRENPDLVLSYAPKHSQEYNQALVKIMRENNDSNEDKKPIIVSRSNYVEYKKPIINNTSNTDNGKRISLRNRYW